MTVETMKNSVISVFNCNSTFFNDYDDSNDTTLVFKASGDNLDDINIYTSFREMDNGAILVSMGCYDLPNFSKQLAVGYATCNQLNDDELVKYYIDDDGDAVAQRTLIFNGYGVSSTFSPEQVLISATMMALSVDDAYAVLERAKWA